jgi:hypothetical protein
MAIVGLTVNESGESLQRLAVTTKVAIGEVVKTTNGKTRPNKLDHFIFLRKGVKLEWEPDAELMKHYGETAREVFIILLDDEIENVFRTEYAWWSSTEKKCSGDGRKAWRRTETNPDGEEWTPCGDTCPDLDAGRCKPSGDLYFVLHDFPRLGSICRLHTTSYRSIRQLHSALEQIRTVTGGRLAGIRCKLAVRPEKATFTDNTGAKKSTTIYALNIELSAQDMQKLVGEMTQYAKLFDQTKKLLGNGRTVEFVVEDEPDKERAPDVAQEFFPAEDIAPARPAIAQPARASAPASTPAAEGPITPEVMPANGNGAALITREQRRRFYDVAVKGGWNNQQVTDCLLEYWGVKNSSEIPVNKFDEICAAFEVGQMPPKEKALPFQATDEDIPF